MFQRDDWTLFRSLSTLGQKAGVERGRLGSLCLKELVDNALDAGAVASMTEVGGGYMILDDGPGINGTDTDIASLFSIRRPLTSSKLYRMPLRGALGNGLRVVAGTVLASGGKLKVSTKGRTLVLVPRDDGGTTVEDVSPWTLESGTSVWIQFGPEIDTKNIQNLARAALNLRGESHYTGRTSPWWYDSDSFFELLNASGLVPVARVLSAFGKVPAGVTPALAQNVTRTEAENILGLLRAAFEPPKGTRLGVVGNSEAAPPFGGAAHGYAKKTGEFTLRAALGSHHATLPAVVEVWAYPMAGKDDSPRAMVYVNRTPITAKIQSYMRPGRSGEQAIVGCGLSTYMKTVKHPMDLRICITTPYMPITTDGKEPNLEPLEYVIQEAVGSAARKGNPKRGMTTPSGRVYSKKDLIMGVIEEASAIASGDGAHRFSLRQLFYKARPLLEDLGMPGELEYGYFGQVVGEYERDVICSDVPGMYRDTRGTLKHPHEIGQMALGTLNVEKYKRPTYRFNKVIYIEKGGFLPLLADNQWGERHDCAILTSQGFASRAARDLLDLLGSTTEDLQFFCIHDADGPGTMIYEALVEGTLARPGRKVTVLNLGLDPWEASRMGLQEETFERKKGAVPVANYIKAYDRRHGTDYEGFLQTGRYELNAMSSPEFLEWLDEKMKQHALQDKVIPPSDILIEKFREWAQKGIREALIEQAVRDLRIDDRTLDILATMETPKDLRLSLRDDLQESPELPWEKPLEVRVADAVLEIKPTLAGDLGLPPAIDPTLVEES